MKKPVVIHSRADADIDSALEYYGAVAPDEVDRLLTEFERTIGGIGRLPALGSPRYAHELDLPGLLFRMTKRFPYLVFYFERPKEISVVRVLHESRDIPAVFGPE